MFFSTTSSSSSPFLPVEGFLLGEDLDAGAGGTLVLLALLLFILIWSTKMEVELSGGREEMVERSENARKVFCGLKCVSGLRICRPGRIGEGTLEKLLSAVGVYRQACSGISLAVRFVVRDRLLWNSMVQGTQRFKQIRAASCVIPYVLCDGLYYLRC